MENVKYRTEKLLNSLRKKEINLRAYDRRDVARMDGGGVEYLEYYLRGKFREVDPRKERGRDGATAFEMLLIVEAIIYINGCSFHKTKFIAKAC